MKINRLVPVMVPVLRLADDGEEYGVWEMVTGSPTGVPGLVVCPELSRDGEHYTGRWSITHQYSGGAVATYDDPDVAHRKAQSLHAVKIGWSSHRWPVPDLATQRRVTEALASPDAAQPAA